MVTIPPLRERQADIVPLAKHFLNRYTNRYKRDLHFNPIVLDAFSDYQWPGNIREIENLIQSLVITNQNGAIQLSDLPSNMAGHMADTCREPATGKGPAPLSDELAFSGLHNELDSGDRSLKAIMADIERQILTYALKKHGSHTKVAQRFKVDRSTLFRKLRSER